MRLLHLQEQKGSGHLFIVQLPEWGDVPFKLPSIERAQQYSAALSLVKYESDKIALYEYIFRECVADQDLAYSMMDIPAGVVESTAGVILFLSSITSHGIEYTEELFNTFRSNAENDPVMIMKRTVCSVFSGYTFKELDKLDYQELVEVFINAEYMMMEMGLLDQPFSFVDSKQQKKVPVPALPGSMSAPQGMSPVNPVVEQNDIPIGAKGGIDLDALINDGKKAERQLNAVPSKTEYNLHDNPNYQAQKQAILDKRMRRTQR